jgi:heparan-alpha-glucosaminide N-acetyltransferase
MKKIKVAPSLAEARRPSAAPSEGGPAPRNVAIDAYRGFVMLLMMAEVLNLARVSRAFPDNWLLSVLAWNQTHVEWAGCSLHDLIQPSFSFLVGVALPYSLARRAAGGASQGSLFLHALWRSVLLAALGIFLRSMHRSQTYFTFEDTLTQIGLGYPILFLLGLRSARVQWTALGVMLTGYWLAWAVYPLPGPGFDWQSVGVPPDWPHYSGLAAHWDKNANLGQAFDVWFLNLFPRESPFRFNGGGYLTLSFIPTLGTMILGLIAGRWLKSAAPRIPFERMIAVGVAGLALGALLHYTGICPVVKRIWTPSWTIFSGGACFLLLAAFCWIIEARGYKRWAFPLVVIGMNSIAAYLIAHLFENFIESSFKIHLGQGIFRIFGSGLEPLVQGLAILTVYWLMLLWMYRRKLFLRI